MIFIGQNLGAGQTDRIHRGMRECLLIVLVNLCVIRAALQFLAVPHSYSIRTVAAAYPITWGLTALRMAVYYIQIRF